MSWMLFDAGGSRFAIPGADLLEVVPASGLVRVPGAREPIAGALAFRQEVIAVLDLGQMLSRVSTEHPHSVLVVRPLERQLGVLAGELVGLRQLPPPDESTGVFDGELVVDGRPITRIDTERLCAATGGTDV